MTFIKAVPRVLPDGSVCQVFPFHISFEGLEQNIICRNDEDCDALVKCIAVCSRRKNVIVIIYAVVSNHAHIAVLAASYDDAYSYAQEVKRMYSQLFRTKYGEAKVLRSTDVDVQALDTDWYLRNALAYIPRNAFDNGAKAIADYKWTGYRAMFRGKTGKAGFRKVSLLTKRERERIMHTGDQLGGVDWLLNADDEIEPSSFCDTAYLEAAFLGDEAYFMKTIGCVNVPEMTQKLVIAPRKSKTDAEMHKEISELSQLWFKQNVSELTASKKARLMNYIYKSMKTTENQLARCFGMERETVHLLIGKSR